MIPCMGGLQQLTATQKIGIYLFAAVIGRLAGFIANAVHLYVNLGWAATWINA
jgi:hypothetical protein